MTDWLLHAAYLAPVGVSLMGAGVVLLAAGRRAPRAARLGGLTFLGLLAFNAAMLGVSESLVYDVRNGGPIGGVVSLMVWRWQVMMLLSAGVHGAAVWLLTAAILADRPRPPAPPEG